MLKQVTLFVLVFGLASASTAPRLLEMRLTAAEVRARASQPGGNQIGSSKLVGVRTTVLYGDPSKAEFYTILLYVPAHTSIPAHSHPASYCQRIFTFCKRAPSFVSHE